MKTELQKNGKTKFETLDSTIITEDPVKGKTEEVGRRVDEVNNEMAMAMGVSKAILNNVIFCHQEDSNWPLDEGKKLKEKFDAIFGTTEYNKAIDKIMKSYKEYQAKQKECIAMKKNLEQTKRDADRKLLDLDLLNRKNEQITTKAAELEVLLKSIDAEMEKVLTKEKQFGELQEKRACFKSS